MPSGFFNYVMNSWMDSMPHLAILIVVAACVGAVAIKFVTAAMGTGKVERRKEWHVEPAFATTDEIAENPWRVERMPDTPMSKGGASLPELRKKR